MLAGSFDIAATLWIIGPIGAFIGGTIGAGVLIMPGIFSVISRLERYEIIIMPARGVAFALAFLSHQLGFSSTTGAFLVSVIIVGSCFSE